MAEGGGSVNAGAASGGFYVTPKKDCPHVMVVVSGNQQINIDPNEKCSDCGNQGENWLCLTCSAVYCSRYVNEHMLKHNQETEHPIAVSYADISVWCYSCDSYIVSPLLQQVIHAVTMSKLRGN